MKHLTFLLTIVTVLIPSCDAHRNTTSDNVITAYQLDSLLGEGGNHYDIASLLYRNPEFLLNSQRSFWDGGRLSYETSSDGQFRVYSIELKGNYPYVENIIQCGDSTYEPMLLLEEMAFTGRVVKVGMHKDGELTYYFPISFQYFCCGGEYISASIQAFSISNTSEGFSIRSESVFKTKRGSLLDRIDVDWDDHCGEAPSSNVFCIELDDHESTNEVYIQVIDTDKGKAFDKAIVYKWDGAFFKYAGIIPKHIENISE